MRYTAVVYSLSLIRLGFITAISLYCMQRHAMPTRSSAQELAKWGADGPLLKNSFFLRGRILSNVTWHEFVFCIGRDAVSWQTSRLTIPLA